MGSGILAQVVDQALTVTVEHTTFDEWWEPFTLGVGPAGVDHQLSLQLQQSVLLPVPDDVVGPADSKVIIHHSV